VEIKILLYIEYKCAGNFNHEEWWGYQNWEIVFYLTMYVLHGFIFHSGVVLVIGSLFIHIYIYIYILAGVPGVAQDVEW
jgi:hypothetical protein